ncbi:Co-chaperone [Coemansia guatemalensis]|uniref:Co-chaperone n=1 Tax=Coemansia guatemalensis TaxID=2761395 RepID=A0A9W8LQH8_9FUNG|nr:Co-chaperone [Coemansia guatemalensis]
MADWRNVGNWHWKEKNCIAWANDYIKKKLTGIEAKGDGINAKVTSVNSVNGDVDLNIRKGRLLAIYEVEVKVSWEASKGDEKLTGEITIPEVAHDTDNFVYEVASGNSAADMLPLRDFVRKNLAPKLGKMLENFTEDLKQENGTEMYISDSKGKDSSAGASGAQQDLQLAKDFKEGKTGVNADVGVAKAKDATFGTVTVKQTAEFMCSVSDLFATLTDPQRVSVWTRGPAEIQPVEGKRFKLFGGHIEGEITKLVPGNTIEQTWRVATWPAGHYSKVTMTLEQLSTSTRLSLVQTGVPLNEESATKANWERYYWNSIKGTFG